MKILCVRKHNYNCAHRLDSSTPLSKQNKSKQTHKSPNCKSIKHPSGSLCPENKTQGFPPASAVRPHGQPLHVASPHPELLAIPLMPQAILSLHWGLWLEGPSGDVPLASTFLSSGDAATASKNLGLSCPCICLSPCPHPTGSPVMACVPSSSRDTPSPATPSEPFHSSKAQSPLLSFPPFSQGPSERHPSPNLPAKWGTGVGWGAAPLFGGVGGRARCHSLPTVSVCLSARSLTTAT